MSEEAKTNQGGNSSDPKAKTAVDVIPSDFYALENMEQNEYPINDVYESIQGEGSLAGTPMVILRLQGCAVGCPFCDTKETWKTNQRDRVDDMRELVKAPQKWGVFPAEHLARLIRDMFPQRRWVLVTGGEPAMFPLAFLVTALHDQDFKVALETSGTESGHVGADFDFVTISPKIGQKGLRPIDDEAFENVDELKMVITCHQDITDFEKLLSGLRLPAEKDGGPVISLQPASQDKKATELCYATVLQKNWKLSVQVQKYLGLR